MAPELISLLCICRPMRWQRPRRFARRPTGICVLRGLKAQTHIVFSDGEIMDLVFQSRPDLVPIDAPLTLPGGRRTIHDRSGSHFRECDRALQQARHQVLPYYSRSHENVDGARHGTQEEYGSEQVSVWSNAIPGLRRMCGVFHASAMIWQGLPGVEEIGSKGIAVGNDRG